MPSIPLPENASLEHLRKQAKLVQDLVRANDQGALDMVDEFHPRPETSLSDPEHFKRSDAQLAVARLYGFPSWTRLRDSLATIESFARPDPADQIHHDLADTFVALACVSYGDADAHARLDEARELLAADPTLATSSPAALAVTGEHDRLATALASGSTRIDMPGGPNNWELLLYVTYSRIADDPPARSSLATAKVLLQAGADPNAGFLWRGLVPPFTALTGAFGRGEQDQPTHPHAHDLAGLLLEAGADPNDGQALYNNGLAGTARDDPSHLELLVPAGLGTDTNGPWYERMAERLTPPLELLHDELEVAAWRGLPRRMAYLVTLDVDLDRPVGRSQQPPVVIARTQQHEAVLEILLSAGASDVA